MARKDRAPVIFCLSQIHSGTWSALAWLVRHQEVPGLLLSTGVYQIMAGQEIDPIVMGPEIYTEKLEPGIIYHEHIRPDYRFPSSMDRSQLMLAAMHPTLIPIRDPLASLISYHHRAEQSGQLHGPMYLPIDHICMRWVILATQELERCQIHFLPCDIHGGPTSAELWWASQWLGLKDREPSRGKFPHQNLSGDYALKEAYRAEDASFIEGVIDDAGQGKPYAFLKNREPQLRPFLEAIGYRNLIWWS